MRLDIGPDLAWFSKRFRGFVGDIETAASENTTDPYKMAVVGRIGFMEEGEAEISWHYCKVYAWTSNFITVGPTAISLGGPATGVTSASYGGYMAAVMDTWALTTMGEWALTSPFPPLCDIETIDMNRWALDSLPELGGDGFYYEGPERLADVRTAAPPLDPNLSPPPNLAGSGCKSRSKRPQYERPPCFQKARRPREITRSLCAFSRRDQSTSRIKRPERKPRTR